MCAWFLSNLHADGDARSVIVSVILTDSQRWKTALLAAELNIIQH